MPKLDRELETYILGTAVKIIIKLSVSTATSCTITIDDPSEIEKISDVDMTKDADYVYSYIFQTSSLWDDGVYIITIETAYGGYTNITQYSIECIDQE